MPRKESSVSDESSIDRTISAHEISEQCAFKHNKHRNDDI
jgi:hypothetical protein